MNLNTWQRNPQSEIDNHDWEIWFSPANEYRGLRFVLGNGWVTETNAPVTRLVTLDGTE